MRAFLRYIYKYLLPLRLKASVDLYNVLRTGAVEGGKEKSVLLLAPHPDDDVISCCGVVQRYRKNGSKIAAVYMTDGRKGRPDWEEEEVVRIRRKEAEEGARIAGIEKLFFLENRDGELEGSVDAVSDLVRILREVKPEAVYFPHFLDNHVDHMATCRIFFSALRKANLDCMCYMWGLWTPLSSFNVAIDITPYMEIKRKSVEAHRSQTDYCDLTGAFTSLNKYYYIISECGKGEGWAEVFLACPAKEFLSTGRAMGWKRQM